MKPYIVATSELTGTKVENLEGKHVGEIEDIMFDPEYGTIAYAVLSFGGFLGIGDKHFAIPVEALGFSDRRSAITLDIDKKNWKTLPGSTRATGRFMLIQSSFIPYMTIMDMSVELHQARPLPNRRKVIENSRGGVPSQHPPIYLSQASESDPAFPLRAF